MTPSTKFKRAALDGWLSLVLVGVAVVGLAGATLAQTPEDNPAPNPQAGQAGEQSETTPVEPTVDVGSAKVQEIRSAFAAIGGFDEVEVDAQAGVVRLRGTVRTPAARRIAEEVCQRIAEPIFVANGIEVLQPANASEEEEDPSLAADDVDQALEGQIRTILATVEELSEVEVSVASGVVHLRGSTKEESARERAVEIASGLDGVLYVDDDIEVVTSIQEQLHATWSSMVSKAKALVGKLPMLGVGLLILFLTFMLARAVRNAKFLGRLFSDHALLQTVGTRIIATAIIVAGIILALDIMEATSIVSAVLGTAGIVGLAIGFAFKDIVENYLAGVLLAVSRPFEPKDHVMIGDFEGKLVRLAARETILMTLDGNHVQIPNAQIFSNPVLNFSRNPKRRFDFTVGIGNAEDLARAQRVAISALIEMEGVMNDPKPIARLDKFDDSSMSLHIYGWVDQSHYDFGKVKSEAIRQVKRVLDENEVDLPNPITQILLEQMAPREPKAKVVESAAPAHDLSVDTEIEEQINDDPQAEKDLLAEEPPPP